ncbi:MAG TPA: hypothetical protein VE620_03425 [Myxococcales bacterium]|jgi:hypothetical protein|nr:hypothetical protein [Myxococcales bacterium]
MIEKGDWRLSGHQANYLHGELLRFSAYRPPRPGWTHDRCEFCWKAFGTQRREDAASEGFYTEDRRWICEPCYEDFKILFDWRLEA